jgi:CheY-like chemotaxis protein
MVHVLVVDGDAAIRELLHDILTDEGHEVAEASNGQAALDFLRTTPLRWIVVLDYCLPVLSGLEVLKTVAADSSLVYRHTYIACPATPHMDTPVSAVRAALGRAAAAQAV